MRLQNRRRAPLSSCLILLSFGLAFAVMAADVFVGPPPFNPEAGHLVNLTLLVDVGADALGSYYFQFRYDPSIVHVTAVQGGTTPEFSAPPVTDPATFASGSTPLAAAQGSPTTPQGFVSVARVTLLAVGLPGDSSSLDAQVNSLFDTQFNALPAAVFPSSVLINVPEVAGDLVFLNSQTFDWSASGAVTSYNVYRGTFGAPPWIFDHTCMVPGLTFPGAFDLSNPPRGRGLYYLVSGVRNGVEGTLGSASTGALRPNALPCGGSSQQITAVVAIEASAAVAPTTGVPASPAGRIVARTPAGDVQQDGFIDDVDARSVLEAVVGVRVLTPAQRANADVDGDGDVDVADAQRIKQYVLGSISELVPRRPGAAGGSQGTGPAPAARTGVVRIAEPKGD